ncbi:MAG: glycosidase [Dehalococcoidia bacterium]
MNEDILEAEQAYAQSLSELLERAAALQEVDVVVGIPFQHEADTIGHVCQTVAKGLSQHFPDEKCAIVCAGAIEGQDALEVIKGLRLERPIKVLAFLMKDERMSRKVWTLRAIMEIADRLNADLALFEADLKSRKVNAETQGLAPEWVYRILSPVRKEGVDLVIPRFSRHYLDAPAAALLVRPLLASVFNVEVGGLPEAMFGISSKLLRTCLSDSNTWADQIGEHGVDTWLITAAVVNQAKICETSLGVKIRAACTDEETVWRQQTEAVFDRIAANKDWWQQEGGIISRLAICGEKKKHRPEEITVDPVELIERSKQGFIEFEGLYEEILSREASTELRKLAGTAPGAFKFPSVLWAEIVHDFLLIYCLGQEFAKHNIINAFVPICYARQAGFAQEVGAFKEMLQATSPEQAEHLVTLVAESMIEQQVEEFIEHKADFVARWSEIERERGPLLPRVTYREFIPGFPIIAPKEIISPADKVVSTDSIYRAIQQRYRQEFERFVSDGLKVPTEASPHEIAQSLEKLMREVEKDIAELLLPGDLSTVDGTSSVAEAIFQNFPRLEVFALRPEVTSWILQRNPPNNLLIRFGAANLAELGERYGPNDILALSSLSEETEYLVNVWEWIESNARPEHFTRRTLKPLVVSGEDFPMLSRLREPSAISKLAGRIVVGNLRKGAGGAFPKLRYFLTISKNIVEAESYGEIWEQYARERKEFGTRVVNSLRGHWGTDLLSAHNIFENRIQRKLIEHVRQMIGDLERGADSSLLHLTTRLRYLADCYYLTSSFPDGTFIPCSAWTWASYSYKGGKGVPTPLSLRIERDWASRDFLVEMIKALGGSEDSVDRKITELMGQGREWENLTRLMLPGWEIVEEVTPEQLPQLAEPEAGRLTRFTGNPILRAVAQHPWESKYVFNAGAIRLDGRIYILYRACGEDEVSRIGLAVSLDGLHIEERLDNPIFEPQEEWERKGCEDPRLVLVGERIYMLYTAYSSIAAQIALASIDLDDFLNRRWSNWRRHGLTFPGFENKDAILFPQMFNGRYVMYHRTEPSIWISSSEQLACPWSREEHRILLGPGAGGAWDGVKVGGGSQPIKTTHGWLLIYHGVDNALVYRLGVLLVALDDPGRLLYRSPNPILEPEATYEHGEEGCYVPTVVFTCGAVPGVDKEVLEDDDELLVYYGAADTALCVAAATVSSLIPEEIRQARNHGNYIGYDRGVDELLPRCPISNHLSG